MAYLDSYPTRLALVSVDLRICYSTSEHLRALGFYSLCYVRMESKCTHEVDKSGVLERRERLIKIHT